jgi:uncharacterized SAM-binding protein YcdF (DUF218 family)
MGLLKNKIMIAFLLLFRKILLVFGVFSFLLFVLSFSSIPYYAYRYLSMENQVLNTSPNFILVLGGSGMPSPDGLMRSYYAAESALQFPSAKIIIAHPYSQGDSLLQLNLMARELTKRGIDSTRIFYEPFGFNTHSQATNIVKMLGKKNQNSAFLVVTSPEHMYRAIKSFHKAGLLNVGAAPAFENPLEEEKMKDREGTKDTHISNLTLRYNIWSYLHYEILVLREYCAIFYYKIKGWI